MAVIITERDIEPLLRGEGDPFLKKCAYNALDVCTPHEIHDVILPTLDPDSVTLYKFEHACQGPALTMTLRGVMINKTKRAEAIAHYEQEEVEAAAKLTQLAAGVWDQFEPRLGRCTDIYTGELHKHHLWPRKDPKGPCRRCQLPRLRLAPVNPTSSVQLARLFYTLWGMRVRRAKDTGRPTTDKEALEAIRGEAVKLGRLDVAEAANQALRGKGAQKIGGYLRSRCGHDGRMRSTMTVGAAETARWSANKAPDWTGWNIQQLPDRVREIIEADKGLEIGYADLEQAESHFVAYDSGDEGYIAAHRTGDVHTYVCRLMWPSLAWTGDLKHDRALANEPPDFDPYHSRRDYGKRFQHGGNMGRTPQGVARQIHCPISEAEEAYGRMYGGRYGNRTFDGAFPGIKLRHQQVWAEIQQTGVTVSSLGRRRQFLGRTWTSATLREALGQLEQSPVADLLNLSLCLVWRELDTRVNIWDHPNPDQPNRVWLLAQVHDAILFLYRPGDHGALQRVKSLMEHPILVGDRSLTIPVEIAVGPNWSHAALKKVKF